MSKPQHTSASKHLYEIFGLGKHGMWYPLYQYHDPMMAKAIFRRLIDLDDKDTPREMAQLRIRDYCLVPPEEGATREGTVKRSRHPTVQNAAERPARDPRPPTLATAAATPQNGPQRLPRRFRTSRRLGQRD